MTRNRKQKETAESKEKAKFRRTATWKKFRQRMRSKNKVDFVTQKPLLKGFQVHHCDMRLENYKELKEENFYCLNKTTHEMIHFLFRYTNWRELLERIKIVLEKMESLNKQEQSKEL